MNPKLENEHGWKLTQKDYDAGWRLFTDEKPPGGSYFYTYDFYDGPHYSTYYVSIDRKYFESYDYGGPLDGVDVTDYSFTGVWHPLVEFSGGK